MKTIKSTALFVCLFSTHAMVGSHQAVEAYLANEFRSVSSVSEFNYLGQTTSCDEVVDTYVIGKISSIETAYNCTICLVNDDEIATVDSLESVCSRD